MKNKLSDLNDHLFAELERLGDEEIIGEKLQEEIGRAKAITDVAGQAIANASLVLKVEILRNEYAGADKFKLPLLLGGAEEP